MYNEYRKIAYYLAEAFTTDPDEKVKQRKVSGDWRGHKDTPERPESKENEWVKSDYSPSFHKHRSGKIFRGKRQGTKHHISHITDKKTDKTVELPTKTERDKARKERQERIASNAKKISGN